MLSQAALRVTVIRPCLAEFLTNLYRAPWQSFPIIYHVPRLLYTSLCVYAEDGLYELTLVSPRNYFLYTPLLPG